MAAIFSPKTMIFFFLAVNSREALGTSTSRKNPEPSLNLISYYLNCYLPGNMTVHKGDAE